MPVTRAAIALLALSVLAGYEGPESVRYDPEQDAYFISNQSGAGSDRDGNGYIIRVDAAAPERSTMFAEGGRGGVVLDSPKGLMLHGDTLWAADIDKLRGFDRRTGAPLATIDFAGEGAVQLNDIAIAPDGSIHVTDTGIGRPLRGLSGRASLRRRFPGGRLRRPSRDQTFM